MVGKVVTTKWLMLLAAKFPIVLKGLVMSAAVFIAADIAGFPIHDIWFDYVLFMVASALIGGMPEPDTNLTFWKFMYLWTYRSGHLLVASATAYFLHQAKWEAIRAGDGTTVNRFPLSGPSADSVRRPPSV